MRIRGLVVDSLIPLCVAIQVPGQVDWRAESPEGALRTRGAHAMAFDAARGVGILAFGRTVFGPIGDCWSWNGSAWSPAGVNDPLNPLTPREGSAMAYDPVRQTICLFGGKTNLGMLAETLEWNGTRWVDQIVLSPGARYGHSMCYDPVRSRVVLFGGESSTGLVNDLWEWDGTTWVRRTVTGGPAPRRNHGVAFDTQRGRMIVFGGWGGPGALEYGDTWAWDGTAWSLLSTPTAPTPRISMAMAYDPSQDRCVVHGGYRNSAYLGDTWVFDGQSWTQVPLNPNPGPRAEASFYYDSVSHQLVLAGGAVGNGRYTSDVWTWRAGTWRVAFSVLVPTGNPVLYQGGGVAYDRSRKRLVFSANDTWEWDGKSWSFANAAAPLSSLSSSAFDPVRGRIMMLLTPPAGGSLETWEWDGISWTQLHPLHHPTHPTLAVQARIECDPKRNRVVAVVMLGIFVYYFDTWEWDGYDWSQVVSAHYPPPANRPIVATACDTRRGVVVLVTTDPIAGRDQTWEWDGVDWRQVAGPGSLPPGDTLSMVYDAARSRMVLSMKTPSQSSPRIFEFDGSVWSERYTVHVADAFSIGSTPPLRYVDHLGRTVATGIPEMSSYGPVHPATVNPFGAICGSSPGLPRLETRDAARPWTGDTVALSLTTASAQASWLVLGASNTTWGAVNLPLDLGFLNMPGCSLHVSFDTMVPMPASGVVSVTVPAAWSQVGSTLYAQAFSADPAANPFGVAASNGLALTIGVR